MKQIIRGMVNIQHGVHAFDDVKPTIRVRYDALSQWRGRTGQINLAKIRVPRSVPPDRNALYI